MTNEEHIEQLKKLRSFHNGSYGRSINKAIDALKQEPCTDAVSRQVLIEELTNIAKMKAKSDAQKALIGRCIYFIEHLPPVTPTRPKGKWIMTNDYLTTAYGSIDYVKCSCCGEDSLEEGKYCPNCGADMREGEV